MLELFHVVIFYMSIHFIELCFVFLKGAYTLKRQYFKNAFFHLQPFYTEVAIYIAWSSHRKNMSSVEKIVIFTYLVSLDAEIF